MFNKPNKESKIILISGLILGLLIFLLVLLAFMKPRTTVNTYFAENQTEIEQAIYKGLDPKHNYIKSIQFNKSSVEGNYVSSGDAGGIPYAPHYQITVEATANHNKNYVVFVTLDYPEMTAKGFLWLKKPNPYDVKYTDEMSLEKEKFDFSEKDLSVKGSENSWWNQLPNVWGETLRLENDSDSEIYQQFLACYVNHQAAILDYLKNEGKIGVFGKQFQSVTDTQVSQIKYYDAQKQTLIFDVYYHPNTFDSDINIQMEFTISKADVDDVNRSISGTIIADGYNEQVFQASHLANLSTEVEKYMKVTG